MAEDFEAGAVEGVGAELGLVDAEGEEGAAGRAGEERVDEMDIGFGDEEDIEAAVEFGRPLGEFDDDELDDAEGDLVFEEDFLCGLRGADDHAGDGHVDGVLEAEAEDIDGGVVEEFDDVGEGADAVFEEKGVLVNGVAGVGDGRQGR